MNQNKDIKLQIIEKLAALIDSRIEWIKQSIETAKNSRDNETKSSVGDKYETGRAMVQMEIEKTQSLLMKTKHQKDTLTKIDIQKEFKKVEYGSLVETNYGNYFLSIAFGKIEINEISIFCISPISPLGKNIMKKIVGEKIIFQGKEILVQNIC